ncbi:MULTISPECIES: hypothetical protein [Methanocorpusculum]|nr:MULTISPECIES: hypothetical protein [Methanocorpusculum]
MQAVALHRMFPLYADYCEADGTKHMTGGTRAGKLTYTKTQKKEY